MAASVIELPRTTTVLKAALADRVDGADFFDGIHLSNRRVAQAYADWLAGHIEEAIDG